MSDKKRRAAMLFALALSTLLFVSSVKAIVFTVRTDSGPATYQLDVPAGTPVGGKIRPSPQVGYSVDFRMTAGAAEVVDEGVQSHSGSLHRLGFELLPRGLLRHASRDQV